MNDRHDAAEREYRLRKIENMVTQNGHGADILDTTWMIAEIRQLANERVQLWHDINRIIGVIDEAARRIVGHE